MKKAIIILLVVVFIVSMAACGGTQTGMSKDDMLKEAQEITIQDLHHDFIENKVKAIDTHAGKIYKISAFVTEIEEDYCRIIPDKSLEFGVTVYLPKEDIVSLGKNEKITIVGKLDKKMDTWSSDVAGSTFNYEYCIMNNAYLITNTYDVTGVVEIGYHHVYNTSGKIVENGTGKPNKWYCKLEDSDGKTYSLEEDIPNEYRTAKITTFFGDPVGTRDTITVSGKVLLGGHLTDFTIKDAALVQADSSTAERLEKKKVEEEELLAKIELIDAELQGSWIHNDFGFTFTDGNFTTTDGNKGIYKIGNETIKLSYSAPTFQVVELDYTFEDGKLTLIGELGSGETFNYNILSDF